MKYFSALAFSAALLLSLQAAHAGGGIGKGTIIEDPDRSSADGDIGKGILIENPE